MTQEEQSILLQDLSSRLPYGVKIHLDTPKYGELIGILDAVYPTEERVIVDELDKAIAPINVRCGGFKIEENKVKPYLRPMSSMTEEERNEWADLFNLELDKLNNIDDENKAEKLAPYYFGKSHQVSIDWLNAHHFDYRGLIEKDLALEALEGMYNF